MPTFDARDLNLTIDKRKLKSLYKVQWYRLIADLLFDWAVIITATLLCELYFNPFLYVLAVFTIGARMHALTVLMHDVAHLRFLKNKSVGDIMINLFVCRPMFFTVASYRRNHLLHHQNLNTQKDPDWTAKLNRPAFIHPQGKKQFLTRLAFYLSGIQGIKDIAWFLKRFKKSSAQKNQWGGTVYIILLFAALSFLGYWKIYLLYWLVPFLTTFPMFQYIRSFAEHFGALQYQHLLNSTRTVNASLLEKFFIAPHNIHHHLEYHLYPGVPYYNLPQLKRLLLQDSTYKAQAHYTDGYFSGLLKEL